MGNKIKVGIIGFGRMGGFYLEEMLKNDKWEVAYICDIDPRSGCGRLIYLGQFPA